VVLAWEPVLGRTRITYPWKQRQHLCDYTYDSAVRLISVTENATPVVSTTNFLTITGMRGLSQEKLAEKADMTRNYIGQIERAEKKVTLDALWRIA